MCVCVCVCVCVCGVTHGEVGVEEIQHGSAVLASVEGHTHFVKFIRAIRLIEGGQCVKDLGAE